MKLFRYISRAIVPCVAVSALFLFSCEDKDGSHIESPNGAPVIKYVRVSDPDQSDSLLVASTLGSGIVIMGENLGGTREVWFNNLPATINPTWVTNKTIHVSIPSIAPTRVTDLLYLVDAKGDTLKHPFKVTIPEPVVANARNEWPQAGENLVINGNYFFEPLTVTFSGGAAGEIVSVSQSQIEVKVPDGAVEGPVVVATNFGTVESRFHLWDSRNIILNFDGLNPNGWRIGLKESDNNPLDGNYNVFRGNINANQRDEGPGSPAESPFLFEYWGGNDAARDGNFYPLFPGSYRQYAVKFEAKIDKWYGGHLNICLSEPEHTGNNQEIWSNTYNARAVWAPWEAEDEEVTTDGQWITVVVPMTEFQYFMGSGADGVFYDGAQEFVEENAGTLSMWFLGSPENTGNPVEFHIDNVRIVEL